MAGHSQFKNIMHRKGRQDAQRAKIFTKLIREITTAARLGAADPNANPRLRAAMIAARENNMTRDTIDRAIKRGTGELEGVLDDPDPVVRPEERVDRSEEVGGQV